MHMHVSETCVSRVWVYFQKEGIKHTALCRPPEVNEPANFVDNQNWLSKTGSVAWQIGN